MADLIMQQGGLCCVEPMPRAIDAPLANPVLAIAYATLTQVLA